MCTFRSNGSSGAAEDDTYMDSIRYAAHWSQGLDEARR
jgi:hypothetical protein